VRCKVTCRTDSAPFFSSFPHLFRQPLSFLRHFSLVFSLVLSTSFSTGLPYALASPPNAVSLEQFRTITVFGDADVKVVPDKVVITVGVVASDMDILKARKKNDDCAINVYSVAKKHNIPTRDIQSNYLSIEPRYRSDYEHKDFIGYFASRSVQITSTNLGSFEVLISDLLTEAGVTDVRSVNFYTTELRKYRDEARDLALKAAKEKAERMAAALGQKVGMPRRIEELDSRWWSWYSSPWGGFQNSMSQNVVQSGGEAPEIDGATAPGMITVNAKVSVEFELEL
jgi:uncharacterized protein